MSIPRALLVSAVDVFADGPMADVKTLVCRGGQDGRPPKPGVHPGEALRVWAGSLGFLQATSLRCGSFRQAPSGARAAHRAAAKHIGEAPPPVAPHKKPFSSASARSKERISCSPWA